MSIPAALSFEYSSSNGECVGNNQVDSLELKASQRVCTQQSENSACQTANARTPQGSNGRGRCLSQGHH